MLYTGNARELRERHVADDESNEFKLFRTRNIYH